MAEAQREFSEQGYVMLPGLISQPELRRVANQLAQEFDGWNARKDRFQGGGLMSGHLNCYPGRLASGVVKELREAGVFELTQSLLPTDPKAFRLGCNFNLPGSVPQHWHVDGAFLQQFLIVNVAVVDTNLTNGAIAVVPETHKRFYKYWEFAAGRVARRSKRLSAQQGDVLIRPSTLWHRGMPNHSSTARPMLAITLGEQGVSNEDPFAYADGRVEFQMNWFPPNLVGRLRERTTIALPVAYSAYRFARSLFGNKGYAAF
ncbi:MAG TPA: phytanoyl-CoA dioxygenase family protein [Polyangiaceae bacterium]|nr:phytanoyl-CoA dioxygenase family protein [Polyangiaceae bacterium]